MAEQTIGELMAGYAAAAVEHAAAVGITLDYDEQSLRGMEDILARTQLEVTPQSAEFDETCKRWGGYFGEVVRRRWGGEWTIETYPGAAFLVVTLSVAGSRIYPAMKIQRRLTSSLAEESIWAFYQLLQERLGETKERIQ